MIRSLAKMLAYSKAPRSTFALLHPLGHSQRVIAINAL